MELVARIKALLRRTEEDAKRSPCLLYTSALLGLDDFRKDAFATGCHAWLLQRKYPHAEMAFSCPRLRPIINNEKINPMDVHERQLLQVV